MVYQHILKCFPQYDDFNLSYLQYYYVEHYLVQSIQVQAILN